MYCLRFCNYQLHNSIILFSLENTDTRLRTGHYHVFGAPVQRILYSTQESSLSIEHCTIFITNIAPVNQGNPFNHYSEMYVMKSFTKTLLTSVAMAGALLGPVAVFATVAAKTVVFVHGAFADGSSFNKVIPLLQAKSLKTIAVQNPMTSLADDVAFTLRAIANAEGSVILVGHSWGGMVITEAGNNDKVESLVYVSAFAPDDGQHLHDILDDAHKVRKIPNVDGFVSPIVDDAGFIRLSDEMILNYFADDVTEEEG